MGRCQKFLAMLLGSHLGVMIKVVILKVLYLVVKENVLHLAQSISKCALFQSLTDEFSSAFRACKIIDAFM